MKNNSSNLSLAAAGLACMITLGAQANLVSNGGFEDGGGSFVNWNTVNNSGFLTVDDGSSTLFVPYNGNDYALFAGSGDSIDQAIATTVGGHYDLSFWLNDKYGNSDVVVSWNNTTVTELPTSFNSGGANNGWVQFDFKVAGNGSTGDIKIVNNSGTVGVDDVNISVAPEPGNWVACVGGALAVGFYWLRSRRQTA